MATRRIKQLMRQAQRKVAIRVVRAYCTVSHAAATVMAGFPPLEYLAAMHKEVYVRLRELRGRGAVITDKIRWAVKLHARQTLMAR